jgi:hypothetical protein
MIAFTVGNPLLSPLPGFSVSQYFQRVEKGLHQAHE